VSGGHAYRPRVVDRELADRLAASPIVVIEGPKACGKTSTAREMAASEVLLDIDAAARASAAIDPGLVLEGPTPRLIDEWQVEPPIWDHIRRAADDRRLPGQFILCGSAVPADDLTRHTGAGRVSRIRMRPMSLLETGHSSGSISLGALLEGKPPRSPDTGFDLARVAERVATGGWPGVQWLPTKSALLAVSSYLDEIRRTDVNRVDGKNRDPERLARLLRSLARNVGTAAAVTKLAAETSEEPSMPLSRETVYDYVSALERLMIVEDQPAWAAHLRSRARARTTPKRHFVDPSLAVAALGASPERLVKDPAFLGFLFESLVVRDLRVYGQASDAVVLQYGDNKGLEVDAIVEARDGRWAAFEIKLGGSKGIEQGAASLRRFRTRIDPSEPDAPACLGVITGTGYGYRRDDGVTVIPIGALGP
jgi:uncharacterized protein